MTTPQNPAVPPAPMLATLAAYLGLVCGLGSLGFQLWIVLGIPEVREQMLAFDFPLTSLGESILAMVIPLALSGLAVLGGLAGWKSRMSRSALVVAALSWAALFTVLGVEGFHTLF